MFLESLSQDLLTLILRYITPTQLIGLSRLSHSFERLIGEKLFWKKYFDKEICDIFPEQSGQIEQIEQIEQKKDSIKQLDKPSGTFKTVIRRKIDQYISQIISGKETSIDLPLSILKQDKLVIYRLARANKTVKIPRDISFYIDPILYSNPNEIETERFIERMLQIDGLFLKSLPSECRDNPRLIDLALGQNIMAWFYISTRHQNDPSLGRWMVDQLKLLHHNRKDFSEEHNRLFHSVRRVTNLRYYSIDHLEFLWTLCQSED